MHDLSSRKNCAHEFSGFFFWRDFPWIDEFDENARRNGGNKEHNIVLIDHEQQIEL